MQKVVILVSILSVALLMQCASRTKIEYELPPGIPAQNQQHVMNLLNKGAALYKSNCSKCHGIFSKGKDTIPNFTTQQVESYKARFEMSHPENHAFAQNMHREDLDAVFYFLNNRKIKSKVDDSDQTR